MLMDFQLLQILVMFSDLSIEEANTALKKVVVSCLTLHHHQNTKSLIITSLVLPHSDW